MSLGFREKFCSAKLIERCDVSDTLATFRFLPADPLSFTAGQYATLAIEADGELHERPYSIASAPSERPLEFFVELVTEGDFTPKLWELKLGSVILIRRRIVGQFVLDRAVSRHLMIATVTGVAPFVSILRTEQKKRQAASREQFVVIHGASRAADFGPYLGELEQLSRDGWLTYIPTISRPWDEPNWLGETGRVEEVVRKHGDRSGFDHTNSLIYACGHPRMVENVKDIMARARFLKSQIREEEYFVLPDAKASMKRFSLRVGNSETTGR